MPRRSTSGQRAPIHSSNFHLTKLPSRNGPGILPPSLIAFHQRVWVTSFGARPASPFENLNSNSKCWLLADAGSGRFFSRMGMNWSASSKSSQSEYSRVSPRDCGWPVGRWRKTSLGNSRPQLSVGLEWISTAVTHPAEERMERRPQPELEVSRFAQLVRVPLGLRSR
jgi:hypothetical protein